MRKDQKKLDKLVDKSNIEVIKPHDDSGIFVIPFFIPNFMSHPKIIYGYNI